MVRKPLIARFVAALAACGVATLSIASPAAARPLPDPPTKRVVYVATTVVRTVEVPVDGVQLGQIALALLGGVALGHAATARRAQRQPHS